MIRANSTLLNANEHAVHFCSIFETIIVSLLEVAHVVLLWSGDSGYDPGEMEFRVLMMASQLDTYGVDPHSVEVVAQPLFQDFFVQEKKIYSKKIEIFEILFKILFQYKMHHHHLVEVAWLYCRFYCSKIPCSCM